MQTEWQSNCMGNKNSKLVDFQKIIAIVLQYNLSKNVLQYSYQY